jgi:hypothetical protein
VGSQVVLELAVDYASGDEKGKFPKPRKFMFFGEPYGIVLATGSTRKAINRRSIHDHDLVRTAIQKTARNGAGGSLACDALNFILKFLQILEVDCGDDGDSSIEQLFNVLPAMTVWTAGRIVICETINESNLRVPRDYGGNIYYFLAAHLQHRNNFELLQYGLHFRGILRLQGANDDVLPSFMAAAAFVQHLEGFAYARSIAQENLETATPLPNLLAFDFRQQLVGTRPVW